MSLCLSSLLSSELYHRRLVSEQMVFTVIAFGRLERCWRKCVEPKYAAYFRIS